MRGGVAEDDALGGRDDRGLQDGPVRLNLRDFEFPTPCQSLAFAYSICFSRHFLKCIAPFASGRRLRDEDGRPSAQRALAAAPWGGIRTWDFLK
jgi:hypothetical protein